MQQDLITLSKTAAAKIYELISAENDEQLNFRVYIVGGGCSGFQYGFSFDKNLQEDDMVIPHQIKAAADNVSDEQGNEEVKSVKIVVDAMSLQYLKGAEVDYVENLRGSHFTVHNPNANTTCGCGSSFSI